MKIEEQVLSREQMAHLKELGIDTSDASMAWFMSPKTKQWKIKVKNNFSHELLLRLSPERYIPTYTIGDLIRKLPSSLKNEWLSSFLSISTDGYDEPFYSVCYEEEFNNIKGRQTGERVEDALYNLLCWVAKNHKELIK